MTKKAADPTKIITRFKNALTNENQDSIISQYIRRKMPVHFGGMSDPFQPIEREFNVTFKVLKYLCSIQYPIIISTKSTLIGHPKYLDVLNSNPNMIVQFSLSTTSDSKSEIAEPSSTKPSELFAETNHAVWLTSDYRSPYAPLPLVLDPDTMLGLYFWRSIQCIRDFHPLVHSTS